MRIGPGLQTGRDENPLVAKLTQAHINTIAQGLYKNIYVLPGVNGSKDFMFNFANGGARQG